MKQIRIEMTFESANEETLRHIVSQEWADEMKQSAEKSEMVNFQMITEVKDKEE